MKRKEISEYMGELVDVASGLDLTVGLVGVEDGKRKDIDGDLALCLVASALMFCMELLEPDATCPDHADALTAIVTGALHGYLGE